MKRGSLITSLALFVSFLLSALTPFAQAPGAQAAPPTAWRFGAVEAYRASDQAKEAHVGWERIIFSWRSFQPDNPNQWNENEIPPYWLWRAQSEGREVVGVLISTPGWASQGGRSVDVPAGLDQPNEDPRNLWAQYVRRIVTQFKDRVHTWVIWNEPDVSDPSHPGFQFAGDVTDYYRLVKTAYLVGKSVDPNMKISLGGMTYWWDAANGRKLYLERLLDVAASDPTAPEHGMYFDVVPLQLYNDPMSLYDIPQKYRAILAARGLDKPIWINETNVAPWDDPVSPLSRDSFRATQDEQASFVVQAAAAALAAGVERVEFYKMKDDPGYAPGAESFGLVRADGSTRPAYDALRVVTEFFDGAKHATLQRSGSVVRVDVERENDTVSVVWNAGPTAVQATVPALAPQARLIDKAFHESTVTPGPNGYTVWLPGATHNTAPGEPGRYLSGGSPVLFVQAGKPAAAPAMLTARPSAAPGGTSGCEFVLGFKALRNAIPDKVGQCMANEHHNPDNGDGLQETTAWHGKGGLLVWRKSDNWTAFTDGSTTWVNGPNGVQMRPNSERFPWEKDR